MREHIRTCVFRPYRKGMGPILRPACGTTGGMRYVPLLRRGRKREGTQVAARGMVAALALRATSEC